MYGMTFLSNCDCNRIGVLNHGLLRCRRRDLFVGRRIDRRINLGVEIPKRLLRFLVKPIQGKPNRLLLVGEDAERPDDIDQTTSRNDLVQCALRKPLADGFSPSRQVVGKVIVAAIPLHHLTNQDASLHRLGSILLLVGKSKAIKERLVLNAGSDESVIAHAVTLGVGRSDNHEAGSRNDKFRNLLEEDSLAFKHGLKAHNPVRRKVNLVKQQHRTALHGLNDRAVDKDGSAVVQPEATKQIVLVSLRSNVCTNQFALGLGTSLLNHRSLAVARQTRDVDGVEVGATDKLLNVLVVAPRNIGRILGRDERTNVARHVAPQHHVNLVLTHVRILCLEFVPEFAPMIAP